MNNYSDTAIDQMNAAIRDFIFDIPHHDSKTKILYGRDASWLAVHFSEPGYKTDPRVVDPRIGCECGCGDPCPPDAVRVWWSGGTIQKEFALRDFG
jgi:hypothetical protein